MIAEVRDGLVDIATAKAVSCGSRVGGEVEVAVFAAQGEALAVVRKLEGVTRVLPMEAAADPDLLAGRAAELVRERGSTHVFAPATPFGTALIVRLADLFGETAVHEVMRVITPERFARPQGRSKVVTVVTRGWPVFATVRLGAFTHANLPRQRPGRGTPS